MKRIGICYKCKQEKLVRDHHYKGYDIEETKPYCYSCDQKAHQKAREEGRCILSTNETKRLSNNSSHKRSRKIICLSNESILPYIRLEEIITINTQTNNIFINSYFHDRPNHRLKIIDEE